MTRLLRTLGLGSAVLLIAFTVRLAGTPTLPATPYNYANIALPAHLESAALQQADNTPGDNPTTDEGATLGRVLFYDTRLSLNQTISCASCHQQEHGFSDPDAFSTGFDGGLTGRNSMSMINMRFYRRGNGFWDERADSMEDQALMPIQDAVEMGMTLENVVTRLEATTFYADLFEDAFGTPEITSERIGKALAQFGRSIVSYQSRYDEGRAQVTPFLPFPNFTEQENRGKQLFFNNQTNCSNCHVTDAFIAERPRNIGLDSVTTDPGLGGVSGNVNDEGEFKVPSLRNVGLTAPYMHDGRFATLEEVVDFYNDGVQPHPNLDGFLRVGIGGPPVRMNLSADDRAALVAFLHTLTDSTLATDERWSDPFEEATLALAVTPITTTVPASGGPVQFQVNLTNLTDAPQTVESQLVATLPNGSTRVVRMQTVTLPASASVSPTLSEPVPAFAPAGLYTLRVEVGAISDSFTFEKLPPSALADAAASKAGLPTVLTLHAPFPNPATTSATLPFDLPEAADVTVEVLDVRGRRVALLVEERLAAGEHEARWDATDTPSGVYLVRLVAGSTAQTQRVTLVR